MRDEGVPPPGHAKAWAFRQIIPIYAAALRLGVRKSNGYRST
jgi:hypothetical protein